MLPQEGLALLFVRSSQKSLIEHRAPFTDNLRLPTLQPSSKPPVCSYQPKVPCAWPHAPPYVTKLIPMCVHHHWEPLIMPPQRTVHQAWRKRVMKHHGKPWPRHLDDCLVCLHIEPPQSNIKYSAPRLVQEFNPPHRLVVMVAFGQLRQYVNRLLAVLAVPKPLCLARSSTMIMAVLTPWCRMHVNQDLNTIFIRPPNCLVEVANRRLSLDITPIHAVKYPISHRNPHRVDMMLGQPAKVGFFDKRSMVALELGAAFSSHRQRIFIGGIAPSKHTRRHPALGHQPAAQIHPI